MTQENTAPVAQETPTPETAQETPTQAAPETPVRRPLAEVLAEYDPRELIDHPLVQSHVNRVRQNWAETEQKRVNEAAMANLLKTNPEEYGRRMQQTALWQENFNGQMTQTAGALFAKLFEHGEPHLKALPPEKRQEVFDAWMETQRGWDKLPAFYQKFVGGIEAGIRADERTKALKDFEKEKVALRTSWEAEANGQRTNPDLTRGSISTDSISMEGYLRMNRQDRAKWEKDHPDAFAALASGRAS